MAILIREFGSIQRDGFTNNNILSLGQRREISYIPLSILERRSRLYCYINYIIFKASLQQFEVVWVLLMISLTTVGQLWIKIGPLKRQVKFRNLYFGLNTKTEVHLLFVVVVVNSQTPYYIASRRLSERVFGISDIPKFRSSLTGFLTGQG